MHITPDARLDDGLLDVTVVGAMSTAGVPRELPEGVQGHARRRTRRCTTFRGARVELESLDASVPMEVYADGERVGPLPGDDGSRARRADRPRSRSTGAPARGRRRDCPPPSSAFVQRDRRARSPCTCPSCPRPRGRESRRRRCSHRPREERDADVDRCRPRSGFSASNRVVASWNANVWPRAANVDVRSSRGRSCTFDSSSART